MMKTIIQADVEITTTIIITIITTTAMMETQAVDATDITTIDIIDRLNIKIEKCKILEQ